MDKKDYKLAYEYIYNLVNLDDESMKWPLTIDSMNIFKELVDEKLNKPTLEEIQQEWEALGYFFTKTTDNQICLHTKYNGENIILELSNYTYVKYDNYAEPMDITLQEHQLLTKTFKALGWFDE